MFEHGRLIDRLINHWNAMRKDAPMPEYAQFNVGPIEDLWQQCVLFVVIPSARNAAPTVNFYKLGDNVRMLYGSDMTGQTYTTVQRHFVGAPIIRRISELIDKPEPIRDMGQFINAKNKMIKYRCCLLPFGSPERLTHVVAGLSWREY